MAFDPATAVANSRLPMMSVLTKFPATRAANVADLLIEHQLGRHAGIDAANHDGVAGEVAQNALLTTTLFVLDFKDGSYGQTGRKLTVPNSVFLTTKVFHLPKGAYVLHGFKLTFENLNHLKERLDIVRQALTDATAPFADTLKTEAAAFAKRNDADVGDGGWSIQLITSDLGKPMLNISLLCPVKDAARVQAHVTETVLMTEFKDPPADAAATAAAQENGVA